MISDGDERSCSSCSVRPELGRRALVSGKDRFDDLSANEEWISMFPLDRCAAAPLREYLVNLLDVRQAPSLPVSFLSPRAPHLRETISPSLSVTNQLCVRFTLKAKEDHLAAARRRSGRTRYFDSLRLCALCAFARVLRLPSPVPHSPVPHSPFLIPDSRFPIPDSRFPIPDSRFPIPDSRFPPFVTQPRLFPFRSPEMCLFARRQGKISAPRLASTRQAEAHTYI
jgi:hypothetical protein